MKNKILKLRAEGKTYKEICTLLECSKGTVAYHCGEGQKEKHRKRVQKLRKEAVISRRVENFQCDRKLRTKTEDFQRERITIKCRRKLGVRQITFRWREVIDKFGWETICYLTGRPINLREPKTYQFDHKMPYGRGGSSTLDNLGIACKEANQAKSDMTLEELLGVCTEILQHHGYEVKRRINCTKKK